VCLQTPLTTMTSVPCHENHLSSPVVFARRTDPFFFPPLFFSKPSSFSHFAASLEPDRFNRSRFDQRVQASHWWPISPDTGALGRAAPKLPSFVDMFPPLFLYIYSAPLSLLCCTPKPKSVPFFPMIGPWHFHFRHRASFVGNRVFPPFSFLLLPEHVRPPPLKRTGFFSRSRACGYTAPGSHFSGFPSPKQGDFCFFWRLDPPHSFFPVDPLFFYYFFP